MWRLYETLELHGGGWGSPLYVKSNNHPLTAGSLNKTDWLWNLHQPEVPPVVLQGHTGPVF
jgi:hypothetical protein